MTPAAAPEEIAAQLFAAEEGEMLGPVEADDGTYEVYCVRGRADSRLDPDLHETIRDELLEEALAPALARDPLTFLA